MTRHSDFKIAIINVVFLGVTFIFGTIACNNQKTETTTEKDVVEMQNESSLANTDSSSVNDAQFLVEAAEINYHEIALGQLAQKSTKNGDILALAKMMIEDHTKALDELKALADKKSITLPSASPEGQNNLVNKKGKEFDKAYADEMVNGHSAAIEKFEAASTGAKDIEVKSWSTKMLPALHMHLEHATECQKKCAMM